MAPEQSTQQTCSSKEALSRQVGPSHQIVSISSIEFNVAFAEEQGTRIAGIAHRARTSLNLKSNDMS
jgi:hypothetical protein